MFNSQRLFNTIVVVSAIVYVLIGLYIGYSFWL
jgi:hypothetical protein